MQYRIINGTVYYDGNMVLENIGIEINDMEAAFAEIPSVSVRAYIKEL